MQLIAVDIGNSSTKIAVEQPGDEERWCLKSIIRGDEPIVLDSIVAQSGPAFWSASSVNRQRQERLEHWISEHRPDDRFHAITPGEVSLKSNVESREQLGRDRLIAAWMAAQLNDQTGPLIVIDAGTAVTIDVVDRELVFQGGLIFAGAESNFRQLAAGTAALPDLSGQYSQPSISRIDDRSIGKSTFDAIRGGVLHSQIEAIRGIVDRLTKTMVQNGDGASPEVYATGGGLQEITSCLPDEWNFVPDLVLRGARAIGSALLSENSQ